MSTAPFMENTLDWVARLAEFNLLPSRTLHHSRHARFDPDGGWRTLLAHASDTASVHRHWSGDILAALKLDNRFTSATANPTLYIAIQPPDQLENLGAWLGIQLCQARLRTIIVREDLHQLLDVTHAQYMQHARRTPALIHYAPACQWSVADVTNHYLELGHAALLQACGASDDALCSRLRLKLPEVSEWPRLPASDMLLHACLEFLNG